VYRGLVGEEIKKNPKQNLFGILFNSIPSFSPNFKTTIFHDSKVLISYTTMSQLTTNSTKYYQSTKSYVDKTKPLFLHRGTTLWYITFHSSTLHRFLKLILSYYQTTILETEKDYWIIYTQKSTF